MLRKMSFLRRNGNGKKITNNNFRCEIIALLLFLWTCFALTMKTRKIDTDDEEQKGYSNEKRKTS